MLVLLMTVATGALAQSTTHVVKQDNVNTIFSGDGYTLGDAVKDGDVLDFQGTINLEGDASHSLVINKPVNIISSTKNAVVKLNTAEGSPTLSASAFPEGSFVINKAGSGTTVQDIQLLNTETWIYNTSNVTFTGVTFHVEDVRVGSGVGHVAVRYSDHVTFDGCTIYTKNNGASSACVVTGSSFCSFKNCLFENEGTVGNIMYLGNPYSIQDIPDGFPKENNQVVSNDNTLLNCTFKTDGTYSSSRLQTQGKRVRIEGCTVNVRTQFYGMGSSAEEGYTILNNTFTDNLGVPNYSTLQGNTITGIVTVNKGATVTGNAITGDVEIAPNSGVASTFTGNTIFGTVVFYNNSMNNTFTGNTVVFFGEYAVVMGTTANAGNTVTGNVLMTAGHAGDAAVNPKTGTGNTLTPNQAQATTADGLTWTYDFAAKALVLGGTGAMADYEATAGLTTAPWAFLADKTERIVVGEGVSAIGQNAFAGFAGVNTVIANGATPPSLGSGAFDTNATIAAYVPAGTAAAYQTAWGTSVASIADYMSCGADVKALYDASTKTLTIAGNGAMTDFASAADQPWKALKGDIKTVVIENTVTTIGDNAFSGCSALSAVYVEGSGVTVGTDAFSGNADGRKIFVPVANVIDYTTNWTAYAADIRSTGYCGAEGNETDVVWEFNANTMGLTISGTGPMADNGYKQWSAVRTSIESATIEPGVTTIGNSAFASCSKLAAVSIPAGVTSIGSNVFSYCTALLSVSIPSSVTTIGNTAFQKCSKLTAVNIPDGVTSIGQYVFQDCSELTAITIPDDVTSIDQYAFQNCSKLTAINIPDGVTSIGQHAFEGCTLLTAINIPASVASFGNYAFQNCSNLTAVTIADGVSSIGNYAFEGCSELESVSFPASVTKIGNYSFRNCSKLAKVYIYAPSLTTYGYDAFKNNAEGRKIYVPADALDTYKAEWDDYADDIKAMSYYTVTMKDGTEDADKWTVKVGEGEAQAFPVEGLEGGETVTVTYTGTKRVKSVKAVKEAVTVTPAPITVTWNSNDITGSGKSFTKDGVTITVGYIDFENKTFYDGGTFTTTLGNFTKIEVTGADCGASGTGWSGSTWTGNASSVSFSGNIMGSGNTGFVFTIVPTN